eukprot:SAG31_NODE_18319_length_640_cov_1.253235_2_plen_52_part_01
MSHVDRTQVPEVELWDGGAIFPPTLRGENIVVFLIIIKIKIKIKIVVRVPQV